MGFKVEQKKREKNDLHRKFYLLKILYLFSKTCFPIYCINDSYLITKPQPVTQ